MLPVALADIEWQRTVLLELQGRLDREVSHGLV
jgi:hypothetical protein